MEGIGGRVKFLPLAWAGMPKTSFRKNSDSPHFLYYPFNLHFAKATFPGFSATAQKPVKLLFCFFQVHCAVSS
jgi:hypothetical protein